MKACTRCCETKQENEFNKDAQKKGGLCSACKVCMTMYRSANQERIRAYSASWRKDNTDKIKAYGAAYQPMWRKANPDKVKEYCGAWRKANPDKVKEYGAAYCRANRDKSSAATTRRRVTKLQAMPGWNNEFDDFVFAEAYALAKDREKATGIKWHVDHTIPLKSKAVCGLHTGVNIAVIPANENIKKGNRYWPDGP